MPTNGAPPRSDHRTSAAAPNTPIMPVIGITCDVSDRDATQRRTYIDAVTAAGGVPVLLPPPGGDDAGVRAVARAHLDLVDAIVLTGGNDPDLTRRGKVNHPASTLMHPHRQRYEEALLALLDERRATPALGICLGMQQMSLHAGGDLIQHLPDELPSAGEHTGDHHHAVRPIVAHEVVREGEAASWHHQGVRSAGRLRVIAHAHDGLIEAVDDPSRPFYVGVQWHPERTRDAATGARIFEALVAAARSARGS